MGQNQKLQESSLVKPNSTFHTFFTPMQSMQFSVEENEFLQLLILTPTAFGKLLFCSHLIDFHAFFANCKERNNLLEHVKPM